MEYKCDIKNISISKRVSNAVRECEDICLKILKNAFIDNKVGHPAIVCIALKVGSLHPAANFANKYLAQGVLPDYWYYRKTCKEWVKYSLQKNNQNILEKHITDGILQ